MTTSPLTMQQVALEIHRQELAREELERQEALYEQARDLSEEIERLEPYAKMLKMDATPYLLRSLKDPGNVRLLRREMFPSTMNASAVYHANGPVIQTLWACAGLDHDLPSPTMRQLQAPFDLQDRLACALLALQVVEMAQDLRYRLDSTKPMPLSSSQIENLVLSAFNSPDAWVNRFHSLRNTARMQVDGNFHEQAILDRFMAELGNAMRVSVTWERVCQQVPAKLDHLVNQLSECEKKMAPLNEQSRNVVSMRQGSPAKKAPWVVEREKVVLPMVMSAPHGVSVPAHELAALVSQQRSLQRLAARRQDLKLELEGAMAFSSFVARPAPQFVLESLMDLDLVRQLFVEFDPLSFNGLVEYHMQSPNQHHIRGVAIGLFVEAIQTIEPELRLWAPVRPDKEAPGFINCMAGAAMALHCAQLQELLLHRTEQGPASGSLFSLEQLRSLVLSGFENPVVWEGAFAQLCWIVDSHAPLSMATLPVVIEHEASRLLEIPHLYANAVARSVELKAELEEVDQALAQIKEKIAGSIAAFESPGVDLSMMRDLEGAAGGRMLMVRLLDALGPAVEVSAS